MKISLAAARVNAGLTQREAAEKIGVTRITIQNWESYKTSPDADAILRICEAYDISMNNLIFSTKS